MKIKYGDATHVVGAYRLHGARGPFKQGYIDDYEHGAGAKVLEVLKEKDQDNVAVFVVRYHFGANLGKRKFEIYQELAEKAVSKLRQKLSCLNRLNRLNRSSSQLSQLSQGSMDSALVEQLDQAVHDEQGAHEDQANQDQAS